MTATKKKKDFSKSDMVTFRLRRDSVHHWVAERVIIKSGKIESIETVKEEIYAIVMPYLKREFYQEAMKEVAKNGK